VSREPEWGEWRIACGLIKRKFYEEIVTTLKRSKNIGPDSCPDRVNNLPLKVDRVTVNDLPSS
jgi:hypothetical protein